MELLASLLQPEQELQYLKAPENLIVEHFELEGTPIRANMKTGMIYLRSHEMLVRRWELFSSGSIAMFFLLFSNFFGLIT